MKTQRLTILGATGSVGKSTLDVARRHPGRIAVHALTAQRDAAALAALCREFKPRLAVIGDETLVRALQQELGGATRVLAGASALAEVAGDREADTVMSAIVGAAGLPPTLAEAQAHGATLFPIDSEHNAIFQCLPGGFRCGTRDPGVRALVLTASGGPFRDLPLSELAGVTPEQAVRHPNWVMGPKISVDSATMMNKGLELIEAHYLFGMPEAQIQVVLHPESVVHSLVEYADGSTLAQLGQPDMRVPIAHALAFPERWESGVGGLALEQVARLNFRPLEARRYPALGLARDALRAGRIAEIIEGTLAAAGGAKLRDEPTLEAILEVDAWARRTAGALVERPKQVVGHA